MKKSVLLSLLLMFSGYAFGQSLISISPSSGLQSQTLTTTVTGSNFFFTQGSGPTAWGNFYMTNFSLYIYPNWVNIINDDLFEANWTIPTNAAPGNYTVRYEYYDPWNPWPWGGMLTADVPGGFDIVSCPGPVATITAAGPTTVCFPGTVTLNANTGAGFTYQWYRNNGYIAGATGASYNASLTGSYHVRITNQTGCISNSNSVAVTVNSQPASSISTFTPTTFCNGGSVIMYATNYSNASYQWRKNGVDITGATSQTYSANTSGLYDVRITLNSTGCSKLSFQVTVTVLPLPAATATPLGPTTFCSGSGVNLSANSGTGLTYQWYKYTNPVSGAVQQNYYATTSGKYKVQVTDANGCSRKSASITVTSVALPSAVITAQGPTTFCAGDSVTLTANSGAGLTYQWKRYNTNIAGATGISYTAKNAGKYKVLVTNSSGCVRASNNITVTIPCREGLIADDTALPEILYDASVQSIQVTGPAGTLEILSSDGRRVYYQEVTESEMVALDFLTKGIYVAVYRTAGQEPLIRKFYHPAN